MSKRLNECALCENAGEKLRGIFDAGEVSFMVAALATHFRRLLDQGAPAETWQEAASALGKLVECKKDGSVIDELPAAYKDIDEVMANQNDLVEIVHTLKQVLCVKG